MKFPLWINVRRVIGVALAAALVMVGLAIASPAASAGGDFTADHRDDLMALYDYGNGEAGLWAFPGAPTIANGSTQPRLVWNVAPGNFWPSVMKTASADFTGDGISDVLGLYDYGGGEAGLFVFPGTANQGAGATNPYPVWHTPPGNFFPSQMNIAGGDFTGDGKGDLMALYNYGGGEAALFVFPGTASQGAGASNPQVPFHRDMQDFDVTGWALTASDFTGDGKVDLVAWDSNPTYIDVWVFPGTDATGDFASYPTIYHSNWPISNSQVKLSSGDYDGNGVADLMVLADKGNGAATMYVLRSRVAQPVDRVLQPVWQVGPGNFYLKDMLVS